jgi:hypothetical protein
VFSEVRRHGVLGSPHTLDCKESALVAGTERTAPMHRPGEIFRPGVLCGHLGRGSREAPYLCYPLHTSANVLGTRSARVGERNNDDALEP